MEGKIFDGDIETKEEKLRCVNGMFLEKETFI